MILASLLACAMLLACGSDDEELHGVSVKELALRGIVVRDTDPEASPVITESEALDLAQDHSTSPVVDARLVTAQFDLYANPVDHLAWAIEVDASRDYSWSGGSIQVTCLVADQAEVAMVFIDATTGDLEACFQYIPGEFPTPTPGPPSPDIQGVTLGWPAASEMMYRGLQFLDPGRQPEPEITGPEAVEIITAAGLTSRNVEFGRLVDANSDPPLDTIAWAIELYDGVVFVDAESGEILYRLDGYIAP